MILFLTILCVSFGGGLGAVSRHLLAEFCVGILGLPEFAAIMVVNVVGAFLIGLVFVLLEGSYRRDGMSRLRQIPFSTYLEDRDWWPMGDPQLPDVDRLKMDLNLSLLAAFLITGFLGGMTTFSLFSLLSLLAWQAGHPVYVAINAIGSVALGFFAVLAGFHVARMWVPRE